MTRTRASSEQPLPRISDERRLPWSDTEPRLDEAPECFALADGFRKVATDRNGFGLFWPLSNTRKSRLIATGWNHGAP